MKRNSLFGLDLRWFAVASLLLSLGLLVLLVPSEVSPQGDNMPFEEHVVFAPYWSTERGFSTTLYIRNHHVSQSFTAQPVLFSPQGEAVELDPFTLAPRATVEIDLESTLNAAGRSDLRVGAISLRYRSPLPTNIAAVVRLLNEKDSLSFQTRLLEGYAGSASRTIEGYWWFPDDDTNGALVLFNKSESAISVSPTLFLPAGLDFNAAAVELPAFGQASLDLKELLRSVGIKDEPLGGIRLEYTGEPLSLFALGLFSNEAKGFSHDGRFVGHDVLRLEPFVEFTEGAERTLRAFAMLGEPPGDSGFPGGLAFRPKLLMRNATEGNLQASLRFTYMASGAPVTVPLPLPTLFGRETRLVDLYNFVEQGLLPGEVREGVVTISYAGFLNDMVLSLTSVDQSGNWVLPGRVFRTAPSVYQGIYWRTDGSYNTVVKVQNAGAESVSVELRLHYDNGQGEYQAPPVELAPQALHTFDVKQILIANLPDSEGRTFPAGVTLGGLRVEAVGGSGLEALIVEPAVVDPARGTCESDPVCCGFSDTRSEPPQIVGPVGQSTSIVWKGRLCDNTEKIITSKGTFSSSNSSVISVQNGGGNHGLATCNNPGTAQITVEGLLPEGFCYYDLCPLALFLLLIDGDVISVSVSLSPATVAPQAQTTVTTTVLPAQVGRSVSLSVQEVANSGGHVHLNRPLGSFAAMSGTTDAQGKFTTTYTASQFGGQETITATSDEATGTATLNVQVNGLSALAAGGSHALIGPTVSHPNNHFGAATFNTALTSLAAAYHSEFPNLDVIGINDMSLIRGGLFDIGPDGCTNCVFWQPPHQQHRLGLNADVRASVTPPPGGQPPPCGAGRDNNAIPVDAAVRLRWVQLCGNNGINCALESVNTCNEHYHLTSQ